MTPTALTRDELWNDTHWLRRLRDQRNEAGRRWLASFEFDRRRALYAASAARNFAT
jgi:dGTP triphosphohydrolase